MNDKPQTDLAKHVARVIRSMKRQKSVHVASTADQSDSPPQETEQDARSSIDVGSSHMGTEG